MWFFMYIMVLFIPITFFSLGKVMEKKPQNAYFGYRTSRAMKSEESAKFAQKYSARLMMRYAKVTFILSALLYLPSYLLSEDGFALYGAGLVMIQSFLAFWVLYQTEKALKVRFDEEK